MAIGSRRSREEYVFVDGRAVRADAAGTPGQPARQRGRTDAAGVPVADAPTVPAPAPAPGAPTPGASAPAPDGAPAPAPDSPRARSRSRKPMREAARDMAADDALELRDGAAARGGYVMGGEPLMADDRRKLRRLYLVFGLVLLACFLVSCCADLARLSWRSPIEVAQGLVTWVQVAMLFDPTGYAAVRATALEASPEFTAIAFQFGNTVKFALCGVMLAVSGMLYQNAFRNPIAAPSMLGVTNGINFAVLVLVLQFGWGAYQQLGLYYLYSYIGGALVLVLVMLGGRWTSGKRGFNVVNMILMGTIISQLLGVALTYIQNNFLTDMDWEAYNELVQAANVTCEWTYVSLIVGAVAAFAPILLFRFRLNLVSFSDEETRLLGVNPTRLRLLALGCGSVMILTAQVNAGQVAMISLVVPFVVRAVFGSEFRKQLGGNILVGAILLIVCGLLSNFIIIEGLQAGLGTVTTIIALPLFVWMLAIRQRSWD